MAGLVIDINKYRNTRSTQYDDIKYQPSQTELQITDHFASQFLNYGAYGIPSFVGNKDEDK